jgi:hypothetical protein
VACCPPSARGSSTPRSRRTRIGAAVVAAVVVAVVVLAGTWDGAVRGPASPYDHSGFSEVSVATEDVVAGQAGTVVAGLREHGYWCVQPRRNDRAVQITCQSPERDVRVDVVAAPGGDVLYADIDLGTAAASASPRAVRTRLGQVLDASLLRLWPQDRAAIQDLLEDAQPHSGMAFGQEAPPVDPAEQYATHDERTADASWSLWSLYTGAPLALRVRTPGLEDRSWPFGSRHYVTSVDVATTALVADGFTCATSCFRASDGQAVDFDQHDGRIVAVHFTLRSRVDGDRGTDPSGQWVRAGLPFLTPVVRAAVGRRVEECRVDRRTWRGVVAGTPVDIIAVPGAALTPDGRPAQDLVVTIGLPLLHVE